MGPRMDAIPRQPELNGHSPARGSALTRSIIVALATILACGAAYAQSAAPAVRSYLKSGPPEKCVDVVFVGDGYTKAQLEGKYWKDVNRYAKRLLEEMPFKLYAGKFNISAVFLESPDAHCDLSPLENKVHTALECHFDSPGGRLITFDDEGKIKEAIAHVDAIDIVFVMVNTEKYGGSGSVLSSLSVRGRPCPAPVFSAMDTPSFQIAIHELGHSFARLGDEYADPPLQSTYRMPEGDADIGSDNLTAEGRFDPKSFATLKKTLKWRHFLDLPGAQKFKWVYEGGYYRDKGAFRPFDHCKMRKTDDPFCPVCEEAMAQSIAECCGEKWDDAAYHKLRPLTGW